MSESGAGGQRRRFRRLGAAAVSALVPIGVCIVTACSDTPAPGALVVAVDSNVPLPGYITSFGLEATQNGVTMFANMFTVVGTTPIAPNTTQLPGTLALINAGTAGDPITVRLLGLSADGTVGALRQVTTTVPSTGTSLLRLSLDALCFGETDTFPSVDQNFSSIPESGAVGSCPPSQTCVAGGCVAQQIPMLPEYDSAALGDASGTCFPVATCFDDAPPSEVGFETITIDPASCTVPVPLVSGAGGALVAAAPGQLNVGVPLPSADCGGTGTCLAPLDSVSSSDVPIAGFYSDGTLIHLPAGLCVPTAGIPRHTVVEVSTACIAKTVEHPICAPDTRIVSKEPTGDGASSPTGANGGSSFFSGTLLPDGGVAHGGTGTASDGGTDGGSGGGGTDSGSDSGDDDDEGEAGEDCDSGTAGGTDAGGTTNDSGLLKTQILGTGRIRRPQDHGC